MIERWRVAMLGVLSVAQLSAAAWSVVKYESILARGASYRIRTEPVDPADAFRGRFVAVQPRITLPLPVAPETKEVLDAVQSGTRTAFVRLATDEEGFARAAAILTEAPEDGDYLEIHRASQLWTPRSDKPDQLEHTGYSLMFSFDRYYMTESAAPEAERRYADAARRRAETRAWLTVKVKNGVAVIDGLFVDGVPIEELVRR